MTRHDKFANKAPRTVSRGGFVVTVDETASKKKAAPEAAIQRQIIKALTHHGAVVTRVNAGFLRDAQGNVFSGASAGTSDLLCCYRGRYLALEVKAPGGRLTDKQRRFQEQVKGAGGIAFVVRSDHEALAVLAAIDTGEL